MTEANATVEVQLARLGEKIDALGHRFEDEKSASKDAIAAAFKAAETATAAALQAQKESADKTETSNKEAITMHNGLIRKMDNLVGGFPDKDSVAKDFATRDERLNRLESGMARAYGSGAGAAAILGLAIYLTGRELLDPPLITPRTVVTAGGPDNGAIPPMPSSAYRKTPV